VVSRVAHFGFFFQAEDGIRDATVTGVQTCALPISKLLCWDYSGSAEMILRYTDAKFLPGYAAVSRGRVFGYSFFVYENSKGVIRSEERRVGKECRCRGSVYH